MLVNAVILAGGKSSRMGSDKALLPFGGYPTLAEYQYRRLSTVFENVYISTKEDKFDFEAPLIYDKEELSSPMVALASIFKTLKADFFLLSVDMPLLTLESIERLVSLYKEQPKSGVYLFQSRNGLEPTAAIYSYKCYGALLKQIEEGRHSLQEFIRLQSYKTVKIESQEAFLNLNYKREYLKAVKIHSKLSASKRSSEV